MCRFVVWIGPDPVLLRKLLYESTNSLVHQSFNGGFHPGSSRKNNVQLNADGVGIGWYGHSGAAIFRSVAAAWSNQNLKELAGSIQSTCVFAHVRAGSAGTAVSEDNCHPFRYGQLIFQHNGHIEQFHKIKRQVVMHLRDDVFDWIKGTTDSEACFALILSHIDPNFLSADTVPPTVMQSAVLSSISLIRKLINEAGIESGYSTFNFALTDGKTVVVTRYCDKAPRIPPPSLYYTFGDSQDLLEHLSICPPPPHNTPGDGGAKTKKLLNIGSCGECPEDRVWQPGAAFICASEPLTTDAKRWHLTRENTMLCYRMDRKLRSTDGARITSSPISQSLGRMKSAADIVLPLSLDEDEGQSQAMLQKLSLESPVANRVASALFSGQLPNCPEVETAQTDSRPATRPTEYCCSVRNPSTAYISI